MAYFDAGLASGYILRLNISENSQNYAGNYTNVGWSLVIHKGSGTGKWADGPHYWSVNIGGATASGSIGSYDFRGYTALTLGSGSVNIGHSATGYLTIYASGGWNDNDTWGELGDASTGGNVSFSRIPKVPDAPTPIAIDEATSSSFRYRFSGNSDNGAPILEWEAQRATNSSFTTGAVSVSSSGTTTFSGLTPALTYWARSRGRNSQGWGPYSTSLSVSIGLPAPTLTGFTQNTSGALIATWTAPSTTTGITGYRLQIATDSGFTENVVNTDFGVVLTGSKSGLAGGRLYYARVAALTAGGVNAYSSALSHVLVLEAGDLDGWTRVGTKPSQISYYTTEGIRRGVTGTTQALWLESLSTGTVTLAADTYGIQKVVTGLTAGFAYQFTANATKSGSPLGDSYRLSVVSETSATPVTVLATSTSLGTIEFVADSTSATIQILLAESVPVTGAQDAVEKVAFHGIKLLEMDTDYPQRLRGTVFESNLANHFDLACNSVGATWYVAKDGVTRFRLPGAQLPVSAVFSDTSDASAASYVDVIGGYDTRSTVNRIEATNYGVDVTGDVEENDSLIVEDTASQLTYGIFRSTLNLNLYDEAPYDDSFSDRLNALLLAHKTPEAAVSQIRWNAQESLDLALSLEVGQRLTVQYRGVDHNVQIVALTHDIQPSRWMVTLDLQTL